MNKIEPGCKAMIIAKPNPSYGEIVTVINYIGELPNFKYKDQWLIDKEIPLYDKINNEKGMTRAVSERYLKRIDDDDKDKIVSWDDCFWKPRAITND